VRWPTAALAAASAHPSLRRRHSQRQRKQR
jgi:hypothetical protein